MRQCSLTVIRSIPHHAAGSPGHSRNVLQPARYFRFTPRTLPFSTKWRSNGQVIIAIHPSHPHRNGTTGMQTHPTRVTDIFCAGRWIFLLCCLLTATPAAAAPGGFSLDFTTIRLGDEAQGSITTSGEAATVVQPVHTSDANPTADAMQTATASTPVSPVVLVVGGIQGDEPGGFSAATLLTTHYTIQKGVLWVVPNLNFPSIIKRSRGLHGDMNRKFAKLDNSDPEFGTVRRIQELISHPRVNLVLNLHDGSGYYRQSYEDKLRNPNRWGQSVIIDQESLSGAFMGSLGDEARQAAESANSRLLSPQHTLHVHNTKTAEGDHEMDRSLSYFAVRQGKAAFGLEASKEFSVEVRAYYHLLMVESFLTQAGVTFTRNFEMNPDGIRTALLDNLGVSFADNKIFLPLEDVRPAINLLPLSKDAPAQAVTSKPIMAVLPCAKGEEGQYCVHYGNRMITLIRPDWREMDHSITGMRVLADGHEVQAEFGQVVEVSKSLVVQPAHGYRVNAIGYDSGRKDESGETMTLKDFQARFSVDRQGRLYRVEVYKDQRFSGMFLVRFVSGASRMTRNDPLPKSQDRLPDRPGQESTLGF